MSTIKIKRVYEPAAKSDGTRILVDRLWPRGIKKEEANVDAWLKEIAPSTDLRKWFNHEPEKWMAFTKKYKKELESSPALHELLALLKRHKGITLVYSAKDEEHNQAVVLQQYMQDLSR
ncbi:MAG TPA: DUF488 domain-containing protein [Chitinophagaceae bacterium]|jgi:Uncharacterized conserved protein